MYLNMLDRLEIKIKNIFRYKIIHSEINYRIYKFLFNLINLKDFLKNKHYKKKSNENLHSQELNEKGFLFLEDKLCNDLKVDNINNKIKNIINEDVKNLEKNKAFIKLATTEEILSNKDCFEFLTNNKLIGIINSYLGEVPQILHTQVWYSPNKKFIENTSQEFHLDHEDRKQVKLFLFLEDISEDNGPLELISKSHSEQKIKDTGYRLMGGDKPKRLSDKSIILDHIIKCVGMQNSIILVDTSKVLHRGSTKSPKSRTIFMAQYVTKYSTSKNKDIVINNNSNDTKSNKLKLFFEKNPILNDRKKYLKFII